MSSKYIVRQQIKDAKGAIIGYEILYHGDNQAFTTDNDPGKDHAAANTIYNFLTQNTPKVFKGTLTFMTFTTMLLMKKTPRMFDKSELVIQIDDSVIIHPLSMHFVQQYAKEGYRIAVNEFQFSPRYLALLDSISYIKVNAKSTSDNNMKNIIEIAHSMGKQCIITNVDDDKLYQKAIEMGADAMEGSYVAERLTTKAHSSSYLQSNFFRLMVAVTKDEPDMEEIEQLISADVQLSYGLMKIANSAYYALRTRATTIRQGVMTLGLAQLKQWIYLLSASNEGNSMDPGSEEFLKLSFMRANLCNELAGHVRDLPITRAEAYLMGMFSTLSYLIDAPMEEILAEVPLADAVRDALLTKGGRCGELYRLVLSYEAADWAEISALSKSLGIEDTKLTQIYFSCMEDVNTLWEQLTHAYDEL